MDQSSNTQTVTENETNVKAQVEELKGQLAQLESDKRVVNEFKNAVMTGTYAGKDARAVAIGLEFLTSVVMQGSQRIDAIEKQIKELKSQR